jgi:hypothetical protein
MKIKYTPEFEKSLKKLMFMERWSFVNPFEYARKTKWFIQRGRRGYSDMDLWNCNDYLATAVIAFLDHTETCGASGYPMNLTKNRWEKYKVEIRWLMEEHLEVRDTPIEVVISDSYQKRIKKARKIFGEYWQALWD